MTQIIALFGRRQNLDNYFVILLASSGASETIITRWFADFKRVRRDTKNRPNEAVTPKNILNKTKQNLFQ